MSEKSFSANVSTDGEIPDPSHVLTKAMADDFPRFISFLATRYGIEFPVVISLHGVMMTGVVIGYYRYVERFRETLLSGVADFDDDFKKGFGNLVDSFYDPKPDDPEEDLVKDFDSINYLHLSDAQFVQDGVLLPKGERGLLWRCPLSSIDGFSVDALGHTKNSG